MDNDGNGGDQPSGFGKRLFSGLLTTFNNLSNSEKLIRLEFEKGLLHSKFGRALNQIIALSAAGSTLLYVILTYFDKGPIYINEWFNQVDKYICSGMGILWLLQSYVKQHRLASLVSRESILFMIVVGPVLLNDDLSMENPLYFLVALSRYSRVPLFCIIMLRQYELGDTDYERQMRMIFLILVLIVIVSSGIFAEIENSQNTVSINYQGNGRDVPILEFENHDYTQLKYHDALYFVIVTLITVGYGDINPSFELGQTITLAMIVITIVIVPQQTTELLRLVGMQSEFRRAEYKGTEIKHVVVTGYIGIQAIKNFCDELFHDDHKQLSANAILVQDHDPQPDIEIFIHKYDKQMTYLAGDPLEADDLLRAKTHKASACILLTNKNSSNSSEEDYRNILMALAIKKFVYDKKKEQKEDKEPNIKLCMQLIKPESKDLYYKSLNLSPLQDQLIIVEEIKMNLLAKSCFAPGLIAMISNLIASAGDVDTDIIEGDWFCEYAEGLGHEIYRMQISQEDYDGNMSFKKISEVAYQEYSAIVFALEIQSKVLTSKSIIRLNPNGFVFKDWHLFNYYLYIICEDGEVAEDIQRLEMQEEKYERLFGRQRVKNDEQKKGLGIDGLPDPAMTADQMNPDGHQKLGAKADALNTDGGEEDGRASLLGKGNFPVDTESMYSTRKKTTLGKSKGMKGAPAMNEPPKPKTSSSKDYDQEIDKDYERLAKPQTQMEVSEEHLLQKLKNHIVVCGIHSSIMHFILPLRAKYLESKQQDIVIITPIQTIPADIWDTISRFPRIFLINGSPLLLEVLRKAQIHKADKAVILGHDPTTNKSSEINDEMLDAQSIFIYKAIKQCNSNLQIFTEMSFSSNIDFLQSKSGSQIAEFQYSTLFAAGEVYISAMIDTLTAQAFYNPSIVTILQQILVGKSDSFHRDFEKQLVAHFGDSISQSNLWQINVPEECVNKTFDKLYKILLDRGLVTLGLYRLPGATDNNYPYVFSNPNQKTNVTQKDRVFVLGKDIPKDLIIDYSKKGWEPSGQTGASGVIGADGEAPKVDGRMTTKGIDSTRNTGLMANTKDFYGVKQPNYSTLDFQKSTTTPNLGNIGSNTQRSDFMMEGGSAQGTSSKAGPTPPGGTNGANSKTVKFFDNNQASNSSIGGPSSDPSEFKKDKLRALKENSSQGINTPTPGANLGSGASTMEYLRSAVLNLLDRVQTAEERVQQVEKMLKNQNREIRDQVVVEKANWMSQF